MRSGQWSPPPSCLRGRDPKMNSMQIQSRLIVSPIKYHRPVWRYALLFQSWSQFESWLITYALACITVFGFLGISGQPIKAVNLVLVAVATGTLVSVALALPVQFTVEAQQSNTINVLENQLQNMHYRELARYDSTIFYQQKLPRFLRWDESAVSIQRDGNQTIITGPQFILTILRSNLVRLHNRP
ncbi:hypothetical protein SAMN05428948_0794 [Massilia sp. CF038]|nr:hypothetical protein SAMN05428948_0794 [Massilia sp. CF038]